MQPVADRLAGIRHLIFEPDGEMLELPLNLLVTDDASVAAYKARIARPIADFYDFRGTAWLGRAIDVSAGGLTGLARTESSIPVVLNGRQVTASGTLTGRPAGEALIAGEQEEDFTAAPGSTINGCPIDGSGCRAASATTPAAYAPPVQDVIAAVLGAADGPSLGGSRSSAAFANGPLVSFADLAPTAMTPLIDEPVTGAGNDDVWGAIGYGTEKEKKGTVEATPAAPSR